MSLSRENFAVLNNVWCRRAGVQIIVSSYSRHIDVFSFEYKFSYCKTHTRAHTHTHRIFIFLLLHPRWLDA